MEAIADRAHDCDSLAYITYLVFLQIICMATLNVKKAHMFAGLKHIKVVVLCHCTFIGVLSICA